MNRIGKLLHKIQFTSLYFIAMFALFSHELLNNFILQASKDNSDMSTGYTGNNQWTYVTIDEGSQADIASF